MSSDEILQKLKDFRDRKLSLETHAYDGHLGLLYRQLAPSPPIITFEASLDLIQQWIKDSQSYEQNYADTIEKIKPTLEIFKNEKNWENLNMFPHERTTLTKANEILSLYVNRQLSKLGYDLIQRAYDLLRNDRVGNQDNANQINVETILPQVIEIVKDFDLSGQREFLRTLGEIVELGSCPQGRVTRLLSFYITYRT